MKATTILHPTRDDLAELCNRSGQILHETMPDLEGEFEDKPFAVYLHQGEKLIAGVAAVIYGNGIEITLLWVDQPVRQTAIEAELILKAEQFGQQHGAVVSFLKTDDDGEFYCTQGYELCSFIQDADNDRVVFHLRKVLANPAGNTLLH